jgi:hypothetical protein
MMKAFKVLGIAAVLLVGGCANKINMNRSSSVPSAEARLKVNKEGDNKRDLKIEVQHLAPAERVSPQASGYVVWLQPSEPQAAPMNLGVLTLDDQEGELRASTPYEKFQVFITAEQDPQTTAPSGERVLWASVD